MKNNLDSQSFKDDLEVGRVVTKCLVTEGLDLEKLFLSRDSVSTVMQTKWRNSHFQSRAL